VMRSKTSQSSNIDIKLDLEYNKKDKKLVGNGVVYGDNQLSPYGKMIGADDETKSYLNKLVSSIISKSKIINFNPVIFNEDEVRFVFKFETAELKTDSLGRFRLELGVPVGTIADLMPGSAGLYRQSIETDINLPGKLKQNIEVTLNLNGLEIDYSPRDKSVDNGCGDYSLKVSMTEKRLVLSNELAIFKSEYKPEDWLGLRALLLAQTSKHNNSVYFKLESEDNKE